MKFLPRKKLKNNMDTMPEYMLRHYWWAYLRPASVWFFNFQPTINAILFGQYKKLMNATLKKVRSSPNQRSLQIACVYGGLTPKLMDEVAPAPLHIIDVAPIQLDLAKRKTKDKKNSLQASVMNAEQLDFKDSSFSTIVIFFLLHELPPKTRIKALAQVMRVIEPGGVLLVTEYAPLPKNHFFYRFLPGRWLLTTLDPFLAGFWREDLVSMLSESGKIWGKKLVVESDERFFSDFYRVTAFRVFCDKT